MLTWRACAVFVFACAVAPELAWADDVTLRDAIDCKDFKRNADGTWYADNVSIAYGPGKKYHMVLIHSTIRKTKGPFDSHAPILDLLNEKCGAGK